MSVTWWPVVWGGGRLCFTFFLTHIACCDLREADKRPGRDCAHLFQQLVPALLRHRPGLSDGLLAGGLTTKCEKLHTPKGLVERQIADKTTSCICETLNTSSISCPGSTGNARH